MDSNHDTPATATPAIAIVLDTETTGLPPWHRDPKRIADWDKCRMVQLAWMVVEGENNLSSYNAIIKPDGFEIPAVVTNIHGISTERAHKEGRDIEEVLHAFQVTLERFPNATIVAHNLEFDWAILITEVMRLEMAHLFALMHDRKTHCTMRKAVEVKRGKWPKLGALYKELFDVEPEGTAHDAMWDVHTCAMIYKRQTRQI
jgi:DNA polymerase III epsilon subunit-like protein